MRVCAQSKYLTENAFDGTGEMMTLTSYKFWDFKQGVSQPWPKTKKVSQSNLQYKYAKIYV